LNYLIEKYTSLEKNLINLIARRCRDSTTTLFNTFEAQKAKVKDVPNDIEKLVELKEYMANLP
jgi:dynein heavy chain